MQWGLPVLQPDRLRDPEADSANFNENPTCGDGSLWTTLARINLTEPKYGCINVHASLLPKYRGGAPIHWAIINGEKKTGISIMYMVKEMDAGDIFHSKRSPLLK